MAQPGPVRLSELLLLLLLLLLLGRADAHEEK
jgi:hypothetical protein